MKKSTFLGSTTGLLLLFSVISYSRTPVQQQNPKPSQQASQTAAAADAATPSSNADVTERRTENDSVTTATDAKSAASETYEATAYSLRGRTASGAAPSTGMIAADPRFLPIGSRVRIEAGSYSGEYLVADTGGAVRGKRIDIWTPSAREAMRFGRRRVKVTVLHLAGKRGAASTRARTIKPTQPSSAKSQP